MILLQQCLPLAVLKLKSLVFLVTFLVLQQCLPLAVLKHSFSSVKVSSDTGVATVLTACGIETLSSNVPASFFCSCCNSAYRLRY